MPKNNRFSSPRSRKRPSPKPNIENQIDPCVWRQCVIPPPPEGHNLLTDHDGHPVDFWFNVTYR